MARTKAHQKYIHPHTGKPVPGATTIINNHLAWKWPALSRWMVNQAKQELDPDAIRDVAANIGTLAHAMIEDHIADVMNWLDHEPANLKEYAQTDIDLAENAFIAFLDWEQAHHVIYKASELQLVHTKEMYGGTIDLLAEVDGELTMVDFKTSSGVYSDHIIQAAAYQELLFANKYGYPPVLILHLGKDGRMTEHHFTQEQMAVPWHVFAHCLALEALKPMMPRT